MQEILLEISILKEDYQKAFKKLTLFFLSRGPGTSDQSLIRLQNKFRKTALLAIYYLTKFEDKI